MHHLQPNMTLLPLTEGQQDIYFDQLHNLGCPLYNIGGYIKLPAINEHRLRQAHQDLVEQSDVFGLRILHHDDKVYQCISTERDTTLSVLDLSDKSDPQLAAEQWVEELFSVHLPIENCSLYKSCLLKLSDNSYYYVGLAHHLMIDGFGFANWAKKLSEAYNRQAPSPALSWPSVVEKDLNYQQSSRRESDRAYWKSAVQSLPKPFLPPQYRYLFPDNKPTPSKRHNTTIPADIHAKIVVLAKNNNVAVGQIYLGAILFYFSRNYGTDDFVIGCPLHNRNNAAEKNTIGVFTGISPMVLSMDKTSPLVTLYQHIKNTMRKAFKHQKYPIGHIIRELAAHKELYQIGFNYLSLNSFLDFNEDACELVYTSHNNEQTPIMFTIWEYGDSGKIDLKIDHNLSYFSSEDISLLARRLVHILSQLAISDESTTTADLELLPPQELALVHSFSVGETLDYAKDKTVTELFEAQAAKNPEHCAIVTSHGPLTYQQLNHKVNQFSHYLLAQGCQPGDYIGIHLERDQTLVVALLAVLKIGGRYIPLDPKYPSSRLEAIARDSELRWLISNNAGNCGAISATVIHAGDEAIGSQSTADPAIPLSLNDVAYVIYTSGSTGNPKGVLISHANLLALLYWARATYNDQQLRAVLASTSINFDLSAFELFVPLSFGFTTVLVENALSLLQQAADVSLINTVPSAIKTLIQMNAVPEMVHTVNLAGEPLTRHIVNDLLEGTNCQRVHNLYGPSEDTTYSTNAVFTKELLTKPHIGRPIANTQAFVLDDQLQPAPIGICGELYLAGQGVSQGYLNQPDLTAERFIQLKCVTGPAYKTGDLVRWRPDGNLDYIGRNDNQVKIRGHRIELGDIDFHLCNIEGVKEAVTIVASDQLISYVTYHAESNKLIKRELSHKLPAYMIPSVIVELTELPLLPNGKVDKHALPVPVHTASKDLSEKPANDTEQTLAHLWAKVLNCTADSLGVNDSFFSVGGHSLSAVELSNEIRHAFAVNFPFQRIFEFPSIRQISEFIRTTPQEPLLHIRPIPVRNAGYDLSFSQQRLWFFHQINGASTQYNMAKAFLLNGVFDPRAAEQALTAIGNRHKILHTRFAAADGQPQQYLKTTDFTLSVHDLTDLAPEQQADQVRSLLDANHNYAFQLEKEPLLRMGYIAISSVPGEARGFLYCNMHHIVSDGYSIALLIREFNLFYNAAVNSTVAMPTPLPIQYTDYVYWEQEWFNSANYQQQLSYWKKQLDNIPLVHSLPLSFPRPAIQKFAGDRTFSVISSSERQTLQHICEQQGATLFMGLYSLFSLLIARYSNETDIVIGVPCANRQQPELDSLIGFFVNNLVLRCDFSNNPTFINLLQQNKEVVLDAFNNQQMPFDRLVDSLVPERSLSYSPLIQIMLVYQNNSQAALELSAIDIEEVTTHSPHSKVDLTLIIHPEHNGDLKLEWEYDEALFSRAFISDFADHFARLLRQVCRAPEQSVLSGNMLSQQQQQHLLVELNPAIEDAPLSRIIDVFEQQVSQTPDAIAISWQGQHLSYAQLSDRADKLACALSTRITTCEDPIIGVCLERSIDLIVAIIAVLKTGAAYVPIDPDYPLPRQHYIIKDSNISQLITTTNIQRQLNLENVETICLDSHHFSEKADPDLKLSAKRRYSSDDSLFYIVYTSGSTGQPKGVMISQKNVATLINWVHKTYKKCELSSVLFSTSVCFDLSIYEIFAPLTCGGQITIVSNILNISQSEPHTPLTLINSVPSALETLTGNNALPASVQVVNCAGEPLSTSLVNKLYQAGVKKVYDLYGPSEDTTYSSFKLRESGQKPSIGRPIDNTQFFIVNSQNALVPKGVMGELLIGGSGLALGYLNRTELTQQRFIENPFSSFAPEHLVTRVYRTGDLVRYNALGDIEYCGRMDHQVKLRGFRVELGEIEHQLVALPNVRNAVVLVRSLDREEQQLIAIIETADENTSQNIEPQILDQNTRIKLEQHLSNKLPHYMLPATYIKMGKLPLTPNAKIDRKQLMLLPLPAEQRTVTAPKTLIESKLHNVWCSVLGMEASRVSTDSSFFTLGGNSLHSSTLIHRLSAQYNINLSLKELFEHQTIQKLADYLDARQQDADNQFRLQKNAETGSQNMHPLSFTQQRIWLVEQIEGATNKHNVFGSMTVKGSLNPEKLKLSFENLVRHHAILKAHFTYSAQGDIQQQVSDSATPHFYYVDESQHPTGEGATSRINKFCSETFDLSKPSLIKMMVIQLSPELFKITLCIHHIITDGWSLSLLFNEFIQRYFDKYPEIKDSPSALNYFDYVACQQDFLASAAAEKQRTFWQAQLKEMPAKLQLPFPKQSPDFEQKDCSLIVSMTKKLALQEFAQTTNTTLFNIVHCAFSVILARITNRYDFVLGVPVANRILPGTENLPGPFVNNLPVRSQFERDMTFRQLLNILTEQMNQVLQHQELPYELVQEALIQAGEDASSPLFNIMLNYLNLPELETAHDDIKMTLDAPSIIANKFDITLYVSTTADGIELRISHAPEKYCGNYMQLLLRQLAHCLDNIIEYSDQSVISMPMLSEGLANIPDPRQDTGQDINWIGSVSQCFENSVRQFPENIAISYKNNVWRYKELSNAVNRCCHYFSSHNLKAGDIVAIIANRNDITILALMSTLKMGACFVMLTDDTPPEKLRQQLQSAKPDAILFTAENVEQRELFNDYAQQMSIINIDVASALARIQHYPESYDGPLITAEQKAYIAFTSGTEGRPKGIAGNQQALSQYLPWTVQQFGLSCHDNYGMLSGLSHDPTQRDVFTALSTGARLSIPESIEDPNALSQWVADHNVSVLNMTASMASYLWGNQCPELRALRLICFCGERLSRSVVNTLRRNNTKLQIINLYGATESCRALSYFDVTACDEHRDVAGIIAIGRGIDDCQLILLNDNNMQCGVGEIGEIGIRSRYLTNGYTDDEPRTREKFIINPFAEHTQDDATTDIIYRTGDLGIYLHDGSVQHVGRKDSQFKIRGFRIETNEIEHAIKTCEQVSNCVVRYKSVNDKWQLIAYLTLSSPDNSQFSIADLKHHLKRFLEKNRIPSSYVVLDEIPLTANKKVDEQALSRLSPVEPKVIHQPSTEIERKLHQLWSTVLNTTDICVEQDFFSLGGHSLLVTKLVSRINNDFDISVDFRTIYHNSSIREMTNHIEFLLASRETKTTRANKSKLLI